MRTPIAKLRPFVVSTILACVLVGCAGENIDSLLYPDKQSAQTKAKDNPTDGNAYYDEFYKLLSHRAKLKTGTTNIKALDSLPKEANGGVNWTVAVTEGYINPRPSLDPNVVDEPPLSLNIFLEAKTNQMANVLFPHSIHTYWLSCKNCHPKIFIPEAGANPITMTEIWKGEWCGRCHGKVAFPPEMPRENCVRCHTILKGQSLEKEQWK